MRASAHARVWLAVAIAATCLMLSRPAWAKFAAGQEVDYRDSWSREWVPGIAVRMLPGGTQVLIREQPSRFYPEGFERAYALDAVRARQAAGAADASPAAPPAQAAAPAQPVPPPAGPATPAAADAGGLLSEQDVLDYARNALGPDPWGNPRREQALAEIRDHIKRRGVDFQSTLDFSNKLGALGANSVHISSAIGANYGPAPRLEDYFGTFALTSHARGATSSRREGSRLVVTTTDSGARLGSVEIKSDGTYAWDVLGDGKLLTGTWRLAREDEMQAWEGGPALWLLKARGGEDYMVRAGRQPGWPGWVDIGIGPGRIAIQYGRKL